MKIGNIEINEKYPLFLAPMEDVTDRSFRLLCKEFGADVVYSEFVASEALIRNIEKSLQKLKIEEKERPIGIQLYGHQIDVMVQAALIAQEAKPDFIDLNFGCPVKKIAIRGAGAGLLRDIPKMVEMTAKIVKAVKLPVTAKTRLGWDNESIVIDEVAERLQDVGIAALAIHARTRAQLYSGTADWSHIERIKNNPRIKIPIIGNGDIDSPQKAKEAFDKYGVDAIMIGRATIGRPYIFSEIKYFFTHQQQMPPLSIDQIVEVAKKHFINSITYKGLPRGIYEMRQHFVRYFKGLPNFKDFKLKLVTSTDTQEILDLLEKIKSEYSNF